MKKNKKTKKLSMGELPSNINNIIANIMKYIRSTKLVMFLICIDSQEPYSCNAS